MNGNRGFPVESVCKAPFFCKLPLLGASKRNKLPSRIICLSQKPFIWNINIPAAACGGACCWSHTPINDSPWEYSRRLQEANRPPVAHSSYLLFGFPQVSCRLPAKNASEGYLWDRTEALAAEPHPPHHRGLVLLALKVILGQGDSEDPQDPTHTLHLAPESVWKLSHILKKGHPIWSRRYSFQP